MASLMTTLARQKRLTSGLVNLIENTIRFHWDHPFYLKVWSEWADSADYKKAPIWLKEYLRGVQEGMFRIIWREKVVFSYEVRGKK